MTGLNLRNCLGRLGLLQKVLAFWWLLYGTVFVAWLAPRFNSLRQVAFPRTSLTVGLGLFVFGGVAALGRRWAWFVLIGLVTVISLGAGDICLFDFYKMRF